MDPSESAQDRPTPRLGPAVRSGGLETGGATSSSTPLRSESPSAAVSTLGIPPPWRAGEQSGPLSGSLRLGPRPSAGEARRNEAASTAHEPFQPIHASQGIGPRSIASDPAYLSAWTVPNTLFTGANRSRPPESRPAGLSVSAPAAPAFASIFPGAIASSGSGATEVKPFPPPEYLRHSSYYDRFFTFAPSTYSSERETDHSPYSSFVGLPSKDSKPDPSTSKGPSPAAAGGGPSLLGFGSSDFGDRGGLIGLPTCFDRDDCNPLLEVDRSGRVLTFLGNGMGGDREAAAVRANRAMPPQAGIWYYEVEIVSKGVSGHIAVGFCALRVMLSRLPGWESQSWAMHADDGCAFSGDEGKGTGARYGPMCGTGDVIGCGVDWQMGKAFFTKNGVMLGYVFNDIKGGGLYPSVGMRSPGESIRANFGGTPFRFDIEGFTRKRKETLAGEIASLPLRGPLPAPCVPELGPAPFDADQNISETVASMISTYLAFSGYLDTAVAFDKQRAEEHSQLHAPGSSCAFLPALGSSKSSSALSTAAIRHWIRRAVLEGRFETAIAALQEHFPSVLDDRNLLLDLRLAVFVEVVITGPRPDAARMDMDLEDDGDEREAGDGAGPLAVPQLAAGQALFAEFGSDPQPDVQRKLRIASALLAFDDFSEAPEELRSLVSRSNRAALADGVNAAIVGRAAPCLETAAKHTKALFTVLGWDGIGCYCKPL